MTYGYNREKIKEEYLENALRGTVYESIFEEIDEKLGYGVNENGVSTLIRDPENPEIYNEYLKKFPEDKDFLYKMGHYMTTSSREWSSHGSKNLTNMNEEGDCKEFFKNSDKDKIIDQYYKAIQLDNIARFLTIPTINNFGFARSNPREGFPFYTLDLEKDENGNFAGLTKNGNAYKGELKFNSFNTNDIEEKKSLGSIGFKEIQKQHEKEKWLYEKILDAKNKYEKSTGKKHYAEGMNTNINNIWEYDISNRSKDDTTGNLEDPTFNTTKATLKDAWMIQDDIYKMVEKANEKAQNGTLTQEYLNNLDYFIDKMRYITKYDAYGYHLGNSRYPTFNKAQKNKIKPALSYEDWEKANQKELKYRVEEFNQLSDEQKKEEYEKYKRDHEEIIGSKFVERYADKMEGDAFSPIRQSAYYKGHYDNFFWAVDISPYAEEEPEPSEEPTPDETTEKEELTTPNTPDEETTEPTAEPTTEKDKPSSKPNDKETASTTTSKDKEEKTKTPETIKTPTNNQPKTPTNNQPKTPVQTITPNTPIKGIVPVRNNNPGTFNGGTSSTVEGEEISNSVKADTGSPTTSIINKIRTIF